MLDPTWLRIHGTQGTSIEVGAKIHGAQRTSVEVGAEIDEAQRTYMEAGANIHKTQKPSMEAGAKIHEAQRRSEAKRQAELENKPIPEWLDPAQVSGLRNEAVEVLQQFHPRTFGQASRLAGVNPTDLSLVALAVRRGPGDAPVSEGATT